MGGRANNRYICTKRWALARWRTHAPPHTNGAVCGRGPSSYCLMFAGSSERRNTWQAPAYRAYYVSTDFRVNSRHEFVDFFYRLLLWLSKKIVYTKVLPLRMCLA